MSSQEINYTNGSDTGERDAASVAPINPGEKVKAAVFDRPIDNLRNRSEVLRDEVIDQKYLQDTDIMWLIADGADVTGLNTGFDLPQILWDPVAGTFTIEPLTGTAMVLQPIKTPGQDTETSGGEDVVYTFVTDTITITSFLRNYAGGNRREVCWVWDADITGTALASLSGSPNHILTIHVASDGTTQVTDVDNALLALGASLGAAGFAHGVTGGSDLIAAVPADHAFAKIHEREMHRIPQSALTGFFTPSGTHFLSDGDTLAIWYDQMTEVSPGTGGRRQSCPTNANIAITTGQLFITTQEPEKIPNSIPICKRIGNDLIFIDGTVCYGDAPSGMSIYAGEHGYTVNRIYTAASWVEAAITSKWYGSLDLSGGPSWTIDSALNNIIGDLATVGAPSGAHRVGIAPTTAAATSLGFYNVPGTGDSIASTLFELITLLNTKASLGLGAAFDAEEVITGRWHFNNHVRLGADKVILRDAAPFDTDWKLCYRNYRSVLQTEDNTQVTSETYSVYERAHNTDNYGEVLEVFGAYLSGTDEVVSTATGSGNVLVVKRSNKPGTDGSYLIAHRINGGPSTTLDLYDPTHWDYYQHLSYVSGAMTNHVYGQDGTGGRPLTKQHWHIPQVVDNSIDFTDASVISIASVVANFVLEGFWALGPHATLPILYTSWTPNYMLLSPGRAIVNGKPVIKNTNTSFNPADSANWMGGLSGLPTDDTVADYHCTTPALIGGIPGWYYLWLRSDGAFFIGKLAPCNDWTNELPGTQLYRPRSDDVHSGYTQADYVLCDVILLVSYDSSGGNYYFDNAPDVGNGERRLRYRELQPAATSKIDYVFSKQILTCSGDASTYYNNAGGAERCPSIPWGITSNAKILYRWVSDATSTGMRCILGHADGLFFPYHTQYPVMCKDLVADETSIGVIDIVIGNTNGIHFDYADTTGFAASLRLMGFYWDRFRGPSGQRV